MQHCSLRGAVAADEDFLFDLFCRVRRDNPVQLLPEPARSHLLRVQFLGQRQTYAGMFTDAGHQIVLVEGEPVGQVWVYRGGEEIRLVDISLLPERQNKGIGTYLLRGLIAEAQRCGLPLRASASFENAISLRWMQSHGARITGTVAEGFYALEWDTAQAGYV